MKTLLEKIVVNFLRKPKEPPVVPKKTLLERIAVEFLGEEDSLATQQAKQMGLVYKQFGRWADPTTDKITHKSADDGAKLVPWTDEDEEERKEKDGEKEKETEPTAGEPEKKDTTDTGDREIDPTAVARDVRQASVSDVEREEMEQKHDAINTEHELAAGEVGIGGAVPSDGEHRGTQYANKMTAEGGFVDHVEKTRDADAKGFDARVDTIVKHGIAPPDHPSGEPWPPEGVHYATKAAAIRRRDALGSALFGESYDSGSDDHNKCVAKYAAARQVHTEAALEEAKGDEGGIFYKKGKAGYGENEAAFRSWADTAYDTASVQSRKVETGRTSIDPKYPYTHVQSASSKTPKGEPRQDKAQTDDETRKLLQEGLSSAKPEDRKYFDDQLKKFDELDYHDTYVVGYDEQKRPTVYHISNKANDDMKDPHRNGTPKNALKQLRKRLEGSMGEVASSVTEVIEDGIESLGDAKQTSARDCMDLKVDEELIKRVEEYDESDGSPSKYKELIYKASEGRDQKGSFSRWLSEQDPHITPEKLREMSTEDLLKTTQGFMRSQHEAGKNIVYTFAKPFMKAGESAIKAKSEHPVGNIKRNEKDGITTAYKSLTDAITKADGDLGFPNDDGTNGPHTQAYIEFQLDALHYDKYIMNYDDNASVQMGIYDASPADFRESLAELVGFEPRPVDTESGREKLLQTMRERSRIDATSQSIILTTEDEDVVLAEDVWRPAGTDPKVATHLGADMRERLTAMSQARNAEMFESFCPAIAETKTQGEAIRPLLRSLIVRELDRIKNGN